MVNNIQIFMRDTTIDYLWTKSNNNEEKFETLLSYFTISSITGLPLYLIDSVIHN